MKNVTTAPQLRLVGFTIHLSEEEAASGKEWTNTQRVAKLAKAGFHDVAPWPDEEMAALAAKHVPAHVGLDGEHGVPAMKQLPAASVQVPAPSQARQVPEQT